MKNKGLIVIYYGFGKGKTTAALGVALRAAGRGINVKVLQFIKGDSRNKKKEGAVLWTSGEVLFTEFLSEKFGKTQNPKLKTQNLGQISIEPVGTGFIGILGDKLPFAEHKKEAQRALRKAMEAIKSKKWQVVVLDEILRAIGEKLITTKNVLDLIKLKSMDRHLILTGHRVPGSILAKADLVTEMKKVKHPYDKGILAQVGIDF